MVRDFLHHKPFFSAAHASGAFFSDQVVPNFPRAPAPDLMHVTIRQLEIGVPIGLGAAPNMGPPGSQ